VGTFIGRYLKEGTALAVGTVPTEEYLPTPESSVGRGLLSPTENLFERKWPV
jgi:hypothetical protein